MKRTRYIYKHIAAVATSLLLLLSLFPSCSEDDGGGVEVDKYRTLVITLNSLEGALPVTRAEDVTTGENDTQYERHIDKYWLVMLKQSETGTGEFLVDQVIDPESPKYTKPSNTGLNSETELEVEVEIGKTYKFYALANLDGLQNGEDIIEQIEGLKQGNPFDPASLAVKVKEMSAYHDGEGGSYIPMTSYGYEQTITENTHRLDKSIELIRLIGKVTLTVKNLSKDNEITLESLSMGDFRTEGNIYLFPYDVNKGTQILLQTNIDDTYNPTFPNNEEGKHTPTTFAEDKIIEKGEDWLTAGRREMFEETGAIDIEIVPICLYSISTYGLLCYADIKEMAKLPDFEIGEVKLFDDLPTNLTYPSHKMFFERVKEYLKNKNNK